MHMGKINTFSNPKKLPKTPSMSIGLTSTTQNYSNPHLLSFYYQNQELGRLGLEHFQPPSKLTLKPTICGQMQSEI